MLAIMLLCFVFECVQDYFKIAIYLNVVCRDILNVSKVEDIGAESTTVRLLLLVTNYAKL